MDTHLELCDSAKRGKVCPDDICRGCDITLCGFDKEAYAEIMRTFYDDDTCDHGSIDYCAICDGDDV